MTGIFSLSVLVNTGRLRVDPDKKVCKDEILKQTTLFKEISFVYVTSFY